MTRSVRFMILEFILSLVVIGFSILLEVLTSDGAIGGVFDFTDFFCPFAVLIAVILLSGNWKNFKLIFCKKEKLAAADLNELRRTESGLDLCIKTWKYVCFIFPLIGLIHYFAVYNEYVVNHKNSSWPDFAVIILPVFYLCVLNLLFLTLKQKVSNAEILYMAEDSFEEKIPTEKRKGIRFAGVICGILLLIAGTILILYENVYKIYGTNPAGVYIDMPSAIIVIFPAFMLLAVSGSFKTFFASIKAAFINRKLNVTEKSLYLGNIRFLQKVFMLIGISSTLSGWIAMLFNLENAADLAPNLSVSIITIFYAVLLNLCLLPLEIKINNLAEIRE